MLISDKHKFIFIHNPKAAGISIYHALKGFSNPMCRHNMRQFNYYTHKILGPVSMLCNFPRHISAAELKAELPARKWNSYLKFGVVRNPYDRATSFFFYLQQRPKSDKYSLFRKLGNFRNYVLYLKDQNFKETQKYYFADAQGHILMDHILRFENLETDFPALVGRLGLPPVSLPVLNARKAKKDYVEHLDNEILAILNDIYHEDFELFGYEKILSV
jgi:hypothetical protein